MLVVTVQVWPGGRPGRARTVAAAGIANMTPWQDPASYALVILDAAFNQVASGALLDHERGTGPWPLVGAVASLATEASSGQVVTAGADGTSDADVEQIALGMARVIGHALSNSTDSARVAAEEFDTIAFEIARVKVASWQHQDSLGNLEGRAREVLAVAVLLVGTVERLLGLPST